jgi:hypothetical protein
MEQRNPKAALTHRLRSSRFSLSHLWERVRKMLRLRR